MKTNGEIPPAYDEQAECLRREVAFRDRAMTSGRGRIHGRRREGATLVRESRLMHAILGTVLFAEQLEPVLKGISDLAKTNRGNCKCCEFTAKTLEALGR